jgi:hypothetical protein
MLGVVVLSRDMLNISTERHNDKCLFMPYHYVGGSLCLVSL